MTPTTAGTVDDNKVNYTSCYLDPVQTRPVDRHNFGIPELTVHPLLHRPNCDQASYRVRLALNKLYDEECFILSMLFTHSETLPSPAIAD